MEELRREPLTEAELTSIKAGIDPRDLGREFDVEELELIETLRRLNRMKGSARFERHDPFNRHRRTPRGDRRTNLKGEKIGPAWADAVVFKDDESKVVDLEATRYERARAYLVRRGMQANRVSNLKKLGKAARILRGA